jgi:hypothetical protein
VLLVLVNTVACECNVWCLAGGLCNSNSGDCVQKWKSFSFIGSLMSPEWRIFMMIVCRSGKVSVYRFIDVSKMENFQFYPFIDVSKMENFQSYPLIGVSLSDVEIMTVKHILLLHKPPATCKMFVGMRKELTI